jgi:anion-transporting  ArsA/GET3 family ATPase
MATRKIHFFTGKGGVGKSTLAAAYAEHLAAANSSKVLLTELSERSFYSHFFSSEIGNIDTESLRFDLAQWSPNSCLKEYALHLLKIESLYKLFFENPVSKSLIQVAPGLQELAILGKATSSPRRHGPPTQHDEVVLDAFASGHFLNLLRAPKAMSEIISFGPMGEQSKSIDLWIRNPEFTHIHVVTNAESYSITETLELAAVIQSEFKLRPTVYLNKTTGLSGANGQSELLNELIDKENEAREQIKSAGYLLIEIQLDTATSNFALVRNLSRKISGANCD